MKAARTNAVSTTHSGQGGERKKVFVFLRSLLLLVLFHTVGSGEVPQVELSPEEREYLEKIGPITVAPDPEWPPFEYIDSRGNFAGIARDLLDLVEDRLGIEFEYVIPEDWDEALALSRAGEVLILPFLNDTPDRREWLVFTEPLLIDPNVFITREEHPFITDATQLTDEVLVLPSGTSVEERARRDFPNLRILNVPTENDVFKTIVNREADLTIRSLHIAAYTIRVEGLFNLKIAGQAPPKYTNHLRMGVRKEEEQLRDILNKAIVTITPREREEIINRHVNITVIQPFNYRMVFTVLGIACAFIGLTLYWNLRLKKANAAIAEAERSKAVLLANLPGMAYRCRYDRDWSMLFVSEGCHALTGYPSEALIESNSISFNDLIHPEDRGWIRESWKKAVAGHTPNRLEYRIRSANGQTRWVYEQGLPLYREDGTVEELEGLIIDISDRKRLEEELRRSAELIEAKNQDLQQLVHILCHDLGNPVGPSSHCFPWSRGLKTKRPKPFE